MRRRSEAARAPREELPEVQIDAPGDAVNEQVVLGAILADPSIPVPPPDAFDVEEHRVIVAGLVELRRRKLEFDPATLLRIAPEIDIRVVESILGNRPEAPNLDFHLETLGWDWKRRQITRGPLAQLVGQIQDPKAERAHVREALRRLGEMAKDDDFGPSRLLRDAQEVVRQSVASIRERIGGKTYRFGVPALDADENGKPRFFPGPAPGKLHLVTGRSGNGKTTLTEHIALGLARQRRRVLMGAWEEDDYATIEGLAVFDLGWDRARMARGLSSVTDGPLSDEEVETYTKKASGIGNWVRFFENPALKTDPDDATNAEHVRMIGEEVEAAGADVLVLDLFDRCLVDRRPEAEQRALNQLLDLTKRLRIYTIIVHQQLNKGESIRSDNRPSAENIHGSSAYFQNAHLVLAPHVPAKWKDVPDTTVEIFVLKDRDGPSPYGIEVDWEPASGRFFDSRTVPYETDSKFGRARGDGGPAKKKSAFNIGGR